MLDCVISPPDESGITNQIELKIAQNQIDVYATDAGVAPSPMTLRRIAVVTNANLSFSRGLIWLEDVHYNADKGQGRLSQLAKVPLAIQTDVCPRRRVVGTITLGTVTRVANPPPV
jgi:hypothetical protein